MKRLLTILAICVLAAGCLTEYDRRVHREQSQVLLKDADWEKTKARFTVLSKRAVTIKPTGFGLLTAKGTGFIISNDGYVLTCAHVVELMCDLPGPGKRPSVTGQEVRVLFSDGHSANASLVAYNRKFDLALLKTSLGGFRLSAEPEPAKRIMPSDVLVAIVREGSNEPAERLITAGKVIVPYSALPIPHLDGKYTSGVLLRTFGYAGMSGAPLFTRDGRFAGMIKQGVPGAYGDESAFMVATKVDDILRLLPDMKRGISDGAYFTQMEFLAERDRQIRLQKRLAAETNPGFEEDEEYRTAAGVVVKQMAAARDALIKAGNMDRFAEVMQLVCLLDVYTARYMYAPELCAEIAAFFDEDEKPLVR